MARFKYLGEPPRSWVKKYGPCLQIVVPEKNGDNRTYLPKPPATDFPIGQDIGYDITDERSIRYLNADTRFQQIAP